MPYDLVCLTCGLSFVGVYRHQLTCSEPCREKYREKKYGRQGTFNGVPTGTVGAIAEIEIASYLLKKGYAVFRAVSPACFADLIAIKNGSVLQIECRTGYKNAPHRTVEFSRKTHGEINCFGVYVPSDDSTLFFSQDGRTPLLPA